MVEGVGRKEGRRGLREGRVSSGGFRGSRKEGREIGYTKESGKGR